MESSRLSVTFSPNPSNRLPKLQSQTHLNFPSQNCFFCKTHLDLKIVLQRKVTQKAFQCKNKAESGDLVATGDDSGYGFRRKKLAAFVSGGGSNFRSIHEATCRGRIHGDVAVVVTDKPALSFSTLDGLSAVDLVSSLREFEIDFVLLAGFLKLIPVELVRAYPKSILNIHPSLLPSFGGKGYYGLKVHKAVIASGARYSGPTIHFVDEHYDTGRILAQRVVPVLANDTAEELAARVLHQEHQLYVEAVAALCEDRIVWREDGVPLIRSKEDPNAYS
ncbi:hypothetical protein MRB53_032925 [Persea americana]|uniref:Uncharacterized protein n=1 Tax=Persea americana TaxID=3435 RepID=A0ACC2KTQ4_PERAE|nr:hypothetical protein MRB53_032925 [Persea americana]